MKFAFGIAIAGKIDANLNGIVVGNFSNRSSIFTYQIQPEYPNHRYTDYTQVNAPFGINGTVLKNINANALVLAKDYLVKASALANIFRPYGIRAFSTVLLPASIEIGALKNSCPLRSWRKKIDAIEWTIHKKHFDTSEDVAIDLQALRKPQTEITNL
jgi:alpha-glucuronidase